LHTREWRTKDAHVDYYLLSAKLLHQDQDLIFCLLGGLTISPNIKKAKHLKNRKTSAIYNRKSDRIKLHVYLHVYLFKITVTKTNTNKLRKIKTNPGCLFLQIKTFKAHTVLMLH